MPESPRAATPRLPSLTGLRFAAALLVFGVHAYSFIPVSGLAHRAGQLLLDPGDLGVSFFFVLSGFVLAWAARGAGPAPGRGLGRFWAGRVLRIYPAYLVALGLAIGAKWVADLADPVGNRMNQVDGHNLGTSLLLVQAWYPHDVTYLGINPVAWSLSCEIAFYAAFPLLFPLLRRLSARALGVTALGLVAAGLLIPLFAHTFVDPAYQRWFVYVLPATRAVEFALGIVLALLVRSGAWRGPGLPLASALFAANYLVVNLMPHMVQDTSAVLATTALLIPAAATADLTGARSAWRHPTLTRLGDASYAFFLVHLSVLTTGMTILGGAHDYPVWQAVPLALGFLVLGYAVALPLHRYVETPAMLLLRRGFRPGIPAQRSPQPEGIGVG